VIASDYSTIARRRDRVYICKVLVNIDPYSTGVNFN
jgi:predicted transcriptional regulator